MYSSSGMLTGITETLRTCARATKVLVYNSIQASCAFGDEAIVDILRPADSCGVVVVGCVIHTVDRR